MPLSTADEQPHIGCYRLLKTIGKGNFAKVKLAKHVLTGREVRIEFEFNPQRKILQGKNRWLFNWHAICQMSVMSLNDLSDLQNADDDKYATRLLAQI